MIAGLGVVKLNKTVLGVAEGYQFSQDLTLELADRIGALGSQFDVVEFALNKRVDDLLVSCRTDSALCEDTLHVALVFRVTLGVLHDSVLGVVPLVANCEHAIAALGGKPLVTVNKGVLVADGGLDGGAVDGNEHGSSYRLGAPPWARFRLDEVHYTPPGRSDQTLTPNFLPSIE